MSAKNKLIYGVGINDADYQVYTSIDGKRVVCPFYSKWKSMLTRCFSEKYQSTHKTYIGCTVCDDWLSFSKFKGWMAQQDWSGNELDKDLIIEHNKVYSPETCLFISGTVNLFLTYNQKTGLLPGVTYRERKGKYQSRVCNPFTGKQESLGYFLTQEESHLAWKQRKCELALLLADEQVDLRVSTILRERFV